jgi:hypothetical protein
VPCITHAAVRDAQEFAVNDHADSKSGASSETEKTICTTALAERVFGEGSGVRIGVDMDAKAQLRGKPRPDRRIFEPRKIWVVCKSAVGADKAGYRDRNSDHRNS